MATLLRSDVPGYPCRRGKVRDVYDLGDRLVIVAKAAESLEFVTMQRGKIVLDGEGSRFAKASAADRKAIWRQHVLQLRLFRETQEMLHRANGPIDGDLVRETLILNLPGANYEKEFATVVNWARYGNLFDFDESTGQIAFQRDVHSLVKSADRPK